MKRILFWVNDPQAPSFRHRLAGHIPELESERFSCEVDVFPRRRYGVRVLERLSRLPDFDILVLAKLKLETGERALVRRAARRIVYDFDDAIYIAKPDRPGDPPDDSPRRIRKFRKMCAMADLVTAGNETLASFALPFSRRLEVVPTPVDLSRYVGRSGSRSGTRLVWIGMPGNLPYLHLLREPLAALRGEFPGMTLRIISERSITDCPVPVEFVRWSPETEAADLSESDIGVMPLNDDGWTRGKGGFKLLQYMAAGLPCVASPVGVNREIVSAGLTGFLPSSPGEWEEALRRLLSDAECRRRFGDAGRRRVEERYERSIVSRRIVELYRSVAEGAQR
jgi:glycosyltransferase involved in cell wall biosynthesis